MSSKTGTLYWLAVILDDESLGATETLLMVALADHIDQDDLCFVGIERLAKRARCSYGTARRHLKTLEDQGRIVRERLRRKDGNLSVYEFRLVRDGASPPRILRADEGEPARAQVRDDQRAPRCALVSAHPGGRAEPPRTEPPRIEPTTCAEPVSGSGALPLDGMAPAPPTQVVRSPRRDLLFEAVAEGCGIDWSRLTNAARGPLNRAVADLRGVNAGPDEVPGRVSAYRRAFPEAALTPSALAKHWPALDPALVSMPRPRPESVDRQRSEFARAQDMLSQEDQR